MKIMIKKIEDPDCAQAEKSKDKDIKETKETK